MKKLLTALVILIYFVPISFFGVAYAISKQEVQEPSLFGAFLIPMLLMIAVCIVVTISIIGARHSVARSQYLPFRTALVYKLCLIPFYILNFACWMIASMVFHIALFIWPFIPFIIGYTYYSMIGTSVHIIAKLYALRQSNKISTKQLTIHSLFQILFVTDVIDSIYLAIKQNKYDLS